MKPQFLTNALSKLLRYVAQFGKRHYIITALIALYVAFQLFTLIKEWNMKTIIYLIPEDFFGMVFTIHDQPSGVDLTDEGDAYTVRVPENGLVVLKAPYHLKSTYKNWADAKRLFMRVDKAGQRHLMPEWFESLFVNTDRWNKEFEIYEKDYWYSYRDLNGKIQEKLVKGEPSVKNKPHPMIELIGKNIKIVYAERKSRMLVDPKTANDPDAPLRKYDEFEMRVYDPAKGLAWPWARDEDTVGTTRPEFWMTELDYDDKRPTIKTLEDAANRILIRKRAYYKLAPWYDTYTPHPPVAPAAPSPPPVKSEQPFPKTGLWRATLPEWHPRYTQFVEEVRPVYAQQGSYLRYGLIDDQEQYVTWVWAGEYRG